MGHAAFRPCDRVTVVSGAFDTMPGSVISHAEAVARWPDASEQPEVERAEAYWVGFQMFGRGRAGGHRGGRDSRGVGRRRRTNRCSRHRGPTGGSSG